MNVVTVGDSVHFWIIQALAVVTMGIFAAFGRNIFNILTIGMPRERREIVNQKAMYFKKFCLFFFVVGCVILPVWYVLDHLNK